MKKILILSLFLLSSCSALDIVKTVSGLGGKGPAVEANAHIGDNELTNERTEIGDIEAEGGGTVNIDQRKDDSKFKGNASNVKIVDTEWLPIFSVFIIGLLIGWLLLKRPENLFRRGK